MLKKVERLHAAREKLAVRLGRLEEKLQSLEDKEKALLASKDALQAEHAKLQEAIHSRDGEIRQLQQEAQAVLGFQSQCPEEES